MYVRVTKIQDLSKNTHLTTGEVVARTDRSGPVPSPRVSAQGRLRRFLGWHGRYALHAPAESFHEAFQGKQARLIVYGVKQLISGPIIRFRIDGQDTEYSGATHPYAGMHLHQSTRAEVETVNSLYEVVIVAEAGITREAPVIPEGEHL